MTAEETAQVNAYILKLKAQYMQEIADLRSMRMSEQHSRKLAQEQLSKRDEAIRELVKLQPPEPFKTQMGQIFNYYCPDYYIPF